MGYDYNDLSGSSDWVILEITIMTKNVKMKPTLSLLWNKVFVTKKLVAAITELMVMIMVASLLLLIAKKMILLMVLLLLTQTETILSMMTILWLGLIMVTKTVMVKI